MTTIVYRDGIIAFDSRSTRGSLITSDNKLKHHRYGKYHFFCCGNFSDVEDFAMAYIRDCNLVSEYIDVEAFVVYEGVVSRAWTEEGERLLVRQPALLPYDAIGSGQDHAFTAMDMGADAKTAVKMAALRDYNTGGKIRTFRVKEKTNHGRKKH